MQAQVVLLVEEHQQEQRVEMAERAQEDNARVNNQWFSFIAQQYHLPSSQEVHWVVMVWGCEVGVKRVHVVLVVGKLKHRILPKKIKLYQCTRGMQIGVHTITFWDFLNLAKISLVLPEARVGHMWEKHTTASKDSRKYDLYGISGHGEICEVHNGFIAQFLVDMLAPLVTLIGSAISHHSTIMPASWSATVSMSNTTSASHWKDKAIEKLVALEAGSLMPSQIVLIMYVFDTPVYTAIQKEWLKKWIDEVEAQASQRLSD
ncbi:hypothetical protein BS17DRAFT_765139 [Gyrodon lividus]|nr:hypothetical protein BS17DRAFT_765139 [Gyrodon lividus]